MEFFRVISLEVIQHFLSLGVAARVITQVAFEWQLFIAAGRGRIPVTCLRADRIARLMMMMMAFLRIDVNSRDRFWTAHTSVSWAMFIIDVFLQIVRSGES